MRQRIKTMSYKKRLIFLKACYRGLREQYYIRKDLCVKLAIMAGKFTDRNQHAAFDMIKNYNLSRQARSAQSKVNSGIELCSSLHQIWKRRMCAYTATLRLRAFQSKSRCLVLRTAVGHMLSNYTRTYFNCWKNKMVKMKHVDEVNLVGPKV